MRKTMLSRYRPFLHLLLLLFSLLPSHDSFAVNRKRVTFLPYGDSFKPTDRALAADAALRVGIGYRCAAEKRVLAAGATVVLRESQLLLVRLPTPPPALSTFRDEGVAVIPLSAGPSSHATTRWQCSEGGRPTTSSATDSTRMIWRGGGRKKKAVVSGAVTPVSSSAGAISGAGGGRIVSSAPLE